MFLLTCVLLATQANHYNKWDKVFKSGLSKFCGRQPLKNFRGYGLLWNFLKAVFHKIYLVHSWILCPKCVNTWLIAFTVILISKLWKYYVILHNTENSSKETLSRFSQVLIQFLREATLSYKPSIHSLELGNKWTNSAITTIKYLTNLIGVQNKR